MSTIPNGFRLDVFRKRIESKNTLTAKGGLYVGSGTSSVTGSDSNTRVYDTEQLAPAVANNGMPLVSNGSGRVPEYKPISGAAIEDGTFSSEKYAVFADGVFTPEKIDGSFASSQFTGLLRVAADTYQKDDGSYDLSFMDGGSYQTVNTKDIQSVVCGNGDAPEYLSVPFLDRNAQELKPKTIWARPITLDTPPNDSPFRSLFSSMRLIRLASVAYDGGGGDYGEIYHELDWSAGPTQAHYGDYVVALYGNLDPNFEISGDKDVPGCRSEASSGSEFALYLMKFDATLAIKNPSYTAFFCVKVTSPSTVSDLLQAFAQRIKSKPFSLTISIGEGVQQISLSLERNGSHIRTSVVSGDGRSINWTDLRYDDVVTAVATPKPGYIMRGGFSWVCGRSIVDGFWSSSTAAVRDWTTIMYATAKSSMKDRTLSFYLYDYTTQTLPGAPLPIFRGQVHLPIFRGQVHLITTNGSTQVESVSPISANSEAEFTIPADRVVTSFYVSWDFVQYAQIRIGARYGGTSQPELFEQPYSINPSGAAQNEHFLYLLNFPVGSSVGCVQKDTPVLTSPNGHSVPAYTIKVGDPIACWKDGRVVEGTVMQKYFAQGTSRLVRVSLSNGRWLDVTPNHPILCEDGYKSADGVEYDQLLRSDKVVTVDGVDTILSIEWIDVEPQTVVNFLTDGDSFIANGVVVSAESPNASGVLTECPFGASVDLGIGKEQLA